MERNLTGFYPVIHKYDYLKIKNGLGSLSLFGIQLNLITCDYPVYHTKWLHDVTKLLNHVWVVPV